MDSKKLIKKLWKKFPSKVAKKYHDYVGLMVSKVKNETNKVLLCLDVNNDAIDMAIKEGVDLIISHHPFIYGKKKYVLLDPYKKEMYDRLELNNIPVYSFHTNFDECDDGMNDALCEKLELIDVKKMESLPLGRMGRLSVPMNVYDFSKYAVKKLGMNYGQLINDDKNKMITSVAIVGGSGAREYSLAFEEGADIYISGDTPYHIRKELIDKKLTYLHLDHEIEKIFISQMKKILLSFDNTLEIIEFDDVKQAELITL